MKNYTLRIGMSSLNRALLLLLLLGLLTSNGNSQTTTSAEAKDPDRQQQVAAPADGTEDITKKVQSLRLDRDRGRETSERCLGKEYTRPQK